MFNWESAREANQKAEIAELTRKAQMEALRGKNAGKYLSEANANYWDYAGKVGAGGAAQHIATNAEPYISALKNQGAMGTAGIKGEYDVAAAGVTGQSRMGAAEITGGATMGAAKTAADANAYRADQDRGGVQDRAAVEMEIAKIKEEAANGRASADRIARGNELLRSISSNEKIEGMRGQTSRDVASTNSTRPLVAPFGSSVYSPNGMGGLGSLLNGSGGWQQYTPEQEAQIARGVGAGYSRDEVIADLKKRGQL